MEKVQRSFYLITIKMEIPIPINCILAKNNMSNFQDIKLTEYSHGAGCGCKIAPKVLDQILATSKEPTLFPNLMVGNGDRDDAAVVDLGDGTAIVSTTDFFMPIVDDPIDFGKIASVNAISDIYAMGGQPLMAIAILGWPIDKIAPEVANLVMEGARQICEEAGIPLAGGHSIDSPEPIFGLAVTGRVNIDQLKENRGATQDCVFYLTKPIGVGILATAQKRKILKPEHQNIARDSMIILNKIGVEFAKLPYVHALTDVTGFGLLGHLKEMCIASSIKAKINFDQIPLLNKAILDDYIDQDCYPGGSKRNWASYGHEIGRLTDYQRIILTDPQTSGGLLVAVEKHFSADFESFAQSKGHILKPIGFFIANESQEKLIEVI